MKYINQSGLNCWAVCIGCLLDLEEHEVPDFCNIEPVDDWFERTVDWLMERGVGVAMFDLRNQQLIPSVCRARGKWIVTGAPVTDCGCERKDKHAVIYSGADLWWDPHPCYQEREGGLKPGTLEDGTVLFALEGPLALE